MTPFHRYRSLHSVVIVAAILLLLTTGDQFLTTAFRIGNVGIANAQQIRFNRDVQPILADKCFQCHGFDANTREAGLRLDTQSGATAELESGDGVAIAPGKPLDSLLLSHISATDGYSLMPPSDSGKTLNPAEKKILAQWIQQGANYEAHWAFIPPKRQPVPKVQHRTWVRNSIDDYVLAKLEAADRSPSSEADKRTLIRRVAFDLTGLPPTTAQLQQFLGDKSDQAYERMVDRFLDSPNYGEHMTRHWLDLSRYADTSGYQYDRERKMWVWRDWVIHAYNTNMPFDQFTIEQLAGDLLPGSTDQQTLATGFNRNHPITIEGGVIDEEYRTEYVIDRLNTTSTVWMGLTVGCARCHDHKFDPISQKEFYQLAAFFNQVPERGLNGFEPMQQIVSPLAPPPSPELLAKVKRLESELATLKAPPTQQALHDWATEIASSKPSPWQVLHPQSANSTGGATLDIQPDHSIKVGGKNPNQDQYEIATQTTSENITAIRLECLTDPSLPGNGPGRHPNSNFVLSEFELVAISQQDDQKKQTVKFRRAVADYSQANYEVWKAIDGKVEGNNGWAVDGPTRKKPATAIFIAEKPFGFAGGSELRFRLRHEANFRTHGIGRPRFSLTTAKAETLKLEGLPQDVIVAANKAPSEWSPTERDAVKNAYSKQLAAKIKTLQKELDKLAPEKQFPKTMVMKDLGAPRKSFVLERGQYDQKQEEVQPGVPEILNAMPLNSPGNRLGLAKWLVDPNHPLTARVAVNRYWQMLFGRGLVGSVEDFGTQGDRPTHPELLDDLAIRFVESGWDVKAILRFMLNSATYRQSAISTPELLEWDPKNEWYARGPRFRLDAEQIRDQALAVSGLLNPKIGGPSVFPYQPKGLWLELNNRPGLSREYIVGKEEELYRRSMYTFWKRTVLSPMMRTFDAPGREFCTARRFRTNTPLQALLLLNGPQFVEASRKFATRILTEGGATDRTRLNFAFEQTTTRLPDDREVRILREYLQDRQKFFRENPEDAQKMLAVGASKRETTLDAATHAAWMEISRMLLNLDETINRN